MQLFLKRLRFETSKKDKKIRYYACGEYGPDTNRAHYHAIIFGLTLETNTIKKGRHYYLNDMTKELIEKCWKQGFVDVGYKLNDDVALRYVAKYVQKKMTGKQGTQLYEDTGRIAPFALMSRNLGVEWAIANKDRIFSDGGIKVLKRTKNGGKEWVLSSIPRTYLNKICQTEEEKKTLKERMNEEMSKKSLKILEELKKSGIPITMEELIALRADKIPEEMIPFYQDFYVRYGQLPQVSEAIDERNRIKADMKEYRERQLKIAKPKKGL
jgi:hypothetical protein